LEKEKQRSSKLQAVLDGRGVGGVAASAAGPPPRSSGLDPEVADEMMDGWMHHVYDM